MYHIKTLTLLSLLLLAGCQKPKDNPRAQIDPRPEAQAPLDAQQSFQQRPQPAAVTPTNTSTTATDRSHVVLKKESLNKEYLLSTNILRQTPTPEFESYQSRVVSFIERDNKIFMLDVTRNNTVGRNNIPQNLLITEFPILSSTATDIEIDFNEGMKNLIVGEEMRTIEGISPDSEYNAHLMNVRTSYLEEVKVTAESLFIRQVAQIDAGDSVMPVEIRYQIKPYAPDQSFEPSINIGQANAGFFTANPKLLENGSTQILAMKWNHKKPIKWYISANAPEKFRPVLKAALEYWNKALGAPIIQVEQLTDLSISAPRFDMNILQWVENDASGYAKADAHIDPRSGEITSAQIFMTSIFADTNDTENQILLAEVGAATPSAQQNKMAQLKGFKTNRLCQRNVRNEFSQSLRELEKMPKAAYEKAVENYIYVIVAHEMGHVMGLRHNFAGSLAANYDYKERREIILDMYNNNQIRPDIVVSSSVMDYNKFEESAIAGTQLRAGAPALTYDQNAINHLYKKTPFPSNHPAFCTDNNVGQFADCLRYDAGRSVVSYYSGLYQDELKTLPNAVLYTYLRRSKLSSTPANQKPVNEVSISVDSLDALDTSLAGLLNLLKKDTKLISVRSPRFPILETQAEEVKLAEQRYLKSEFDRLGGLLQLTNTIPENFEQSFAAQFRALLQQSEITSGTRSNGSAYAFTTSEIDYLSAQIEQIARLFHNKLISFDIVNLSGAGGGEEEDSARRWENSELTNELAPILLQRFQKYVLAKTGETIKARVEVPRPASANASSDNTPVAGAEVIELDLPVYKYAYNMRSLATGLFDNSAVAIDWAFIEKNQLEDLILADGPSTEQKRILNLRPEALDPTVRRWLLEQKILHEVIKKIK